jgi:ribosome-associated translation inhibitor RaiA
MNQKTHITALHFELSPPTRESVRQTVSKLFQLEAGVVRLDASLEGEYKTHTSISYYVTLRAQLAEEVLFELKQGGQLLPTVQAATDALEQRLRTRTSATTV